MSLSNQLVESKLPNESAESIQARMWAPLDELSALHVGIPEEDLLFGNLGDAYFAERAARREPPTPSWVNLLISIQSIWWHSL